MPRDTAPRAVMVDGKLYRSMAAWSVSVGGYGPRAWGSAHACCCLRKVGDADSEERDEGGVCVSVASREPRMRGNYKLRKNTEMNATIFSPKIAANQAAFEKSIEGMSEEDQAAARERVRPTLERLKKGQDELRQDIRGSVELTWQKALSFAMEGTPSKNKAAAVFANFEKKMDEIAAGYGDEDNEYVFRQIVEQERARALAEYNKNPDAFKKRIGVVTPAPITAPEVTRDECRKMVEDNWRVFLPLAYDGHRDIGLQVLHQFEAKIQTMAAAMDPAPRAKFLATLEDEREKITNEYNANPDRLKTRLGCMPVASAQRHGRTRQPLGELAVKTAVRATVWEIIWKLFR